MRRPHVCCCDFVSKALKLHHMQWISSLGTHRTRVHLEHTAWHFVQGQGRRGLSLTQIFDSVCKDIYTWFNSTLWHLLWGGKVIRPAGESLWSPAATRNLARLHFIVTYIIILVCKYYYYNCMKSSSIWGRKKDSWRGHGCPSWHMKYRLTTVPPVGLVFFSGAVGGWQGRTFQTRLRYVVMYPNPCWHFHWPPTKIQTFLPRA